MLQVINNAYLTKNEFVHYYFKRKKKRAFTRMLFSVGCTACSCDSASSCGKLGWVQCCS